ncbi:MAG: hypothetical protein AAB377_03560 [Patescibacteria group bacterium]
MKNKFFIIGAGFVVLILSIGARFTWENYFSPQAKQNKLFEQNLQKYTSGMEAFEAAMRADTYGGKTPEETLAMFVDALKKGDIELASKYFMLDTNTQSPDYLTRRIWEKSLIKFDNEGDLREIINISVSAKPDPNSAISSDYFVFSSYDKKGIFVTDIDLRINKYSGVWKIESM